MWHLHIIQGREALSYANDGSSKFLQNYGICLLKLIMDWIPWERRKRGHPRKTWVEGVQAAMTTRNLEPDQWRNRQEWHLVSRRR